MDTYDFLSDPRNLTLPERLAVRDSMAQEQETWMHKLQALTEGTRPANDFPAFLLATEPFGQLARRLGKAQLRQELAAEVADELDWFLRAFADYLRSAEGEDVFTDRPPVNC